MEDKILYRYGKPTSFDELPLGTIIHVINDNKVDVYKQVNTDSSNPQWCLMQTINRD